MLARDFEIRQVVDILTRRRQNNPILVGEAGVGKTAVVEGFALRIAQGDVPPVLKNVTVRTLDLALLQAGAGVKGEFENRLKGLINEVKSSATPIILFIDEAHTMIGAGGQAGQNDAANLLKPALARGELRTIAATTWSEYKKYFEKDPALARRFQLVKVEEPTEIQCALMMRGVVPTLENHHNVRILDEGLLASVRLSHRYLPDRQLPDKAISVLDTACARLALGQNSFPRRSRMPARPGGPAVQTRILEREAAVGADHASGFRRLPKLASRPRRTSQSSRPLGGGTGLGQPDPRNSPTTGNRVPRLPFRPRPAGEAAAPAKAWISRPPRRIGRAQRRTGHTTRRDSAAPRVRGRSDRGRGGLRLDRNSGRQDVEG